MSTLWELFDEETRAKLLEQYPELRPVEPAKGQTRRSPVVRMGARNDLIVSIHAQERMSERWGITDQELAILRELGPRNELQDRVDRDRWGAIKDLDDDQVKRFQVVADLSDEEVARLIQGEINDALIAGRRGTVCPIELANNNVERWHARKGVMFCWTKDKSRGYAYREDDEGLIVLTTLIGDNKETSQNKLRHPLGR